MRMGSHALLPLLHAESGSERPADIGTITQRALPVAAPGRGLCLSVRPVRLRRLRLPVPRLARPLSALEALRSASRLALRTLALSSVVTCQYLGLSDSVLSCFLIRHLGRVTTDIFAPWETQTRDI